MNKHLKELIDENRIKKDPVFEINGIKFYEFAEDGVAMSQHRFEAFQDVLSTFNTFNVKKEDLDLYFQMVMDYANSATKSLSTDIDSSLSALDEIKGLTKEMQQRIEYNLPFDRTLALATFLYIHEDENPIYYDQDLNKTKKKLFMQEENLFHFFLQRQLPNFLDLQRVFQPSFQTIMEVANLKKITLLQIYTKSLFGDGQNQDMISNIHNQMEELKQYNNLIDSLSRITTDSWSEN